MNSLRYVIVGLLIGISGCEVSRRVPAFPGAEGFGSKTPGGRGGKVLWVTNLKDDGPGSLRAAVRQKGPRTILFRVGGTIRLNSHLRIEEPYLTIAGQTAPGGGILLRDAGLYVSTHDVILRHLRVRIGASTVEKYDTQDCLHVGDGEGVHDVIVDHCSFSWSIDEVAGVVSGAYNVTFQYCIFSEPLDEPLQLHKKRSHAYCLMLGNTPNRVSVHHNLLAHSAHRNPRIQGGRHDFVNNVVYDWGYFTAVFSRNPEVNFIGNYYKPGPESRACLPLEEKPNDLGKVYVKGNRSAQRPSDDLLEWELTVGVDPNAHRVWEPFQVVPVRTTDADTAYGEVLAQAGARRPQLDSVDQRILNEVKTGAGKIIHRPEEVGGFPEIANGRPTKDTDQDGMPDEWETKHGLNPRDGTDYKQDRNSNGYTNLEDYLNEVAQVNLRKDRP